MSIKVSGFGTHEGRRVDQFHLVSETGVEVDIIGYGVAVRDWRVPVAGGLRSVVMGFERFEDYPRYSEHFGSIAGRVANRIANARFALDGEMVQLAPNLGPHQLHGGARGLGVQVWDGEADSASNTVRFKLFSPDGDMGYPGSVAFEALYRLAGNRLELTLTGVPDRKTPVSLVQHHYFNLGTGDDVLDHRLSVAADARTVLDDNLVADGTIVPVRGTWHDLRAGRTLRDEASAPLDFDGNYCLDTGRDPAMPVAEVLGPDGALRLKLFTDRPGLQVYNSVWCDIPVPGLNGRRYGKYAGLCLEDQMFPNAVNQRHFPDIMVTPEKPYQHWCAIEIGAA